MQTSSRSSIARLRSRELPLWAKSPVPIAQKVKRGQFVASPASSFGSHVRFEASTDEEFRSRGALRDTQSTTIANRSRVANAPGTRTSGFRYSRWCEPSRRSSGCNTPWPRFLLIPLRLGRFRGNARVSVAKSVRATQTVAKSTSPLSYDPGVGHFHAGQSTVSPKIIPWSANRRSRSGRTRCSSSRNRPPAIGPLIGSLVRSRSS